jgi:hypothetical protein
VQRFGDWTVQLSAARVVVAPDAFGGAEIAIEIAAKEIPDRRFRTGEELREAVSTAKNETLRGVVAGFDG